MNKKLLSLFVITLITINFSFAFQSSKAKKFAKTITEKELSDWYELDSWLDEYGLYSYELVGNDDLDYDASKPKDFFESVESVKTAVIDYLLSKEDSEHQFGFYFITVEFEKQEAYLIIGNGHWVDGWSLGHGDCAYVVTDMDAYIEDPENGIFLAKA